MRPREHGERQGCRAPREEESEREGVGELVAGPEEGPGDRRDVIRGLAEMRPTGGGAIEFRPAADQR